MHPGARAGSTSRPLSWGPWPVSPHPPRPCHTPPSSGSAPSGADVPSRCRTVLGAHNRRRGPTECRWPHILKLERGSVPTSISSACATCLLNFSIAVPPGKGTLTYPITSISKVFSVRAMVSASYSRNSSSTAKAHPLALALWLGLGSPDSPG